MSKSQCSHCTPASPGLLSSRKTLVSSAVQAGDVGVISDSPISLSVLSPLSHLELAVSCLPNWFFLVPITQSNFSSMDLIISHFDYYKPPPFWGAASDLILRKLKYDYVSPLLETCHWLSNH